MARAWVVLGMTLVMVASVGVSRARACSPACPSLDGIRVVHRAVAPDGVLVFMPRDVTELLDDIAVEVTRADGEPVPGALGRAFDYLIWRPDCPLTPGEVLSASFTYLDVSAAGHCGGLVDVTFATESVTVVDESLPPLTWPSACLSMTLAFDASDRIGDLVCCDGANPTQTSYPGDCTGEPGPPEWGAGSCTPAVVTGEVTSSVRWDEYDALAATDTVARLETSAGSGTSWRAMSAGAGEVNAPQRPGRPALARLARYRRARPRSMDPRRRWRPRARRRAAR